MLVDIALALDVGSAQGEQREQARRSREVFTLNVFGSALGG